MNAAADSRCLECGEPASSVAPMGLCVVCFQKSTGHSAEEYFEQEAANASSTPPTIPLSRPLPSPPPTGSSDLKPDQTLGGGRFTLIRRLGRGGMGEVWLAHDRDLTQRGAPFPVALKFLSAETRRDAEKLRWLRDEVRICHTLNHDNIVKVYDLHAANPAEPAFLAMEYIEGSTLEDRRLRKPKRYFSWEDLRPYARKICIALEYAHIHEVFHRDLKPANVMVLSNSDETKLADFGLARRLAPGAAAGSFTGRGSGTRGFMSPQQAAGRSPTASDDLYALGATLYHLLTGELPEFREQPGAGKAVRSLVPMSERLATKGRDRVPENVETAVRRCLAEDADDRPNSVYEVFCALGFGDRGSESAPALAAAGSPTSVRRRRGWGWLLVVLLLLLAALPVLVLGPWGKPIAKRFAERTAPATTPDRRLPPRPTVGPVLEIPPPAPEVPAGGRTPPSDPASSGPQPWERPGAGSKSLERSGIPQPTPSAEPASPPRPAGPRPGASWTNSLGMVFRPVPGMTPLVSEFETRLRDLSKLLAATPEFHQTNDPPNQPAVFASWVRATNFCHLLTGRDRTNGLLRAGQRYRLPTLAEWRVAAGVRAPLLGTGEGGPVTWYLWGTNWPPPRGIGNLLGRETAGDSGLGERPERIWDYEDSHVHSAPAGSFPPNEFGLHDLVGNAWELCLDGPSEEECWIIGGGFDTGSPDHLRAEYRGYQRISESDARMNGWSVGFRCVLETGPAD